MGTHKNWELIIVDNNSVDNTCKIINSYKCKKIKLFNIVNKGIIAKSRNFGIKNSNGKYIAFLDSDDYWFKEKLEISLKYIDDYDFIYHPMYEANFGKTKNFTKIRKSRQLIEPV